MSKTASSAASVGMSFENTTAMIATMVEATRESATNIGSAMKSIISRMSEMKSGLSQDENGEFLDASKVETALKSVGVALRDTQGQFRDLDTVLIELGSKWSTLDSATKRYLGTIIAGNRQQSRFLALMENYDRFTEIQESAMNAEDASILQYAKTLDSLETKLNQISNSFQQFYMSILNGPVIGSFLSFLNQVITGFTKLGNFSSLFNIISIIKGVKTLASFLLTTFSKTGSDISVRLKQSFLETVSVAKDIGARAGEAYGSSFASAAKAAMSGQPSSGLLGLPGSGESGDATKGSWLSRNGSKLSLGLNLAGGVFSATGAALSGSGHTIQGGLSSLVGGMASGAATGFALTKGNPTGIAVGAIVGSLIQIPAAIEAISGSLEQEVENLKKKTEELNIQRVEDKQAAEDLSSYIEKYNKLRAAQYDSAEAAQAYVDVQNEIAEKFPQYVSYFDEGGNAIINMSTATEDLSRTLKAAAESSAAYTRQLTEQLRKEVALAEQDLGLTSWAGITKDLRDVSLPGPAKIKNGFLQWENYFSAFENNSGEKISTPNFLKQYEKQAGLYNAGTTFSDRITAVNNLFGTSSLNEIIQKLNSTKDSELRDIYTTAFVGLLGENALSAKKENGTWVYSLSDKINKLQQTLVAYENSMPSGIATMTKSYAATYADIGKYANTLSRFGGEDALISQMIKDAGITDPEKYKQTDYDKYADIVGNWLLNAEDGLANTLQEYLSNWDSVTENQLEEFIDKAAYDKENPLDEMIINAIRKRYQSASADINASLEKNIGKITDENKRKAYDDLFKSGNLTNTQKTQINNEIVATNKIIENKNQQYTDMQVEAAKSRQQLILNAYAALDDNKITPAQRAEFEQALYEDIGTYDWAKKLKLLADKYGIQIKGIDNAVYEALNTRLAAMTDNSELFTNLSSAVDSQFGSGFGTLSDAKQMQQKLGLSGKEFDDVFEWRDSESAYFFKDWNQTYEEVIGNTTKQLATLQSLSRALKLLIGNNEFEGMSQANAWDILQLTPEFQVLDETTKTALKDLWNSADSTANAIKAVVGALANAALGLSDTLRQSGATEAEATAKSVAAELKKRRKDFSSISEFEDAAKYFNADKNGYDTVKLREETGLIYDNMTDTLTKGREYLEKQLATSNDEEYKTNIRKQIDQMQLETEEYAKNLIGKVTQEQIDQLDIYGIDTTLIKVGDEWNKAIEYIGNERAKSIAKAAQAYSREEMKTKLSSGLQDIFTSIVSGEEVAANDVADLVESALGRSLNSGERDAIERELRESPQLLMEQLKAIITASLRSQGVDEEEIQKILTELTITVVETISTAIEDGVSLLAKGITDGISQSELKQLSNFFKVSPDQIASYDQSTGKYRTSGEQFISTLTTSPIMKGHDTYAYSRQLTETLGGKGGVLGSYESITKEIERVEKNIKESTDQEKARLKILKEMQAVYANIADSQRFDFMGYDMMQGQMDDFDNWIGSIQQVQDVFQGLSDSGGKMNYKNFLSMIDYIQKFHPDASSLQIAGQSLDQFAVAIMNTVDIAGNVDFSKVADAMTQGVGQMADAMKETLAEVARERIKTLEATKAALVAQLAVEKALEAMGGKLPEVEWEGKDNLKSVQKWEDTLNKQAKAAIDTMDDLTEEQKAAAKAYLDSFPFGQQILDALGFKPEDIAKWTDEQKALFNQLLSSLDFGSIIEQAIRKVQASGISFSNTEEFMAAFSTEFQRAVLEGWNKNQPKEGIKLEAPNAKIVGDAQIEAPSTTTTSTEAKDTTKALTDTAAAIDKAEEAFKNLGQTGQEEIEKIKTAITDLTTQLDGLKESFNLGATETPMEIQLKAVIGEYTNATGVDPNKQVENLNGTVGSFALTAEGAASKTSLVDDLVATVSSFLPATGVDANSLVSDLTAIVNLSSNPEELYKNIVAYMSTKKVDVAVQLANSGNEQELATLWPNLSTVEQALVQVITQGTAAETAVSNVIAKYGTLGAASLATDMLVGAAESSNQSNLAKTGEAVDNVSTMYGKASTAAGDASTTIAETEKANQDNIEKTGDAAGIAKKKIADMARGEHKIKVNANTKPAIMAANQAVQDIEAKSATIRVTSVYTEENAPTPTLPHLTLKNRTSKPSTKPEGSGSYIGGGGGGGKTLVLWEQGHGLLRKGGFYQGTVNDLGPAYAQGTKTLVGELGPELAVYDNAYHLLGRNGAELVDIPDDAIIFNHKQTEGILKGQANNGRGKTVNGQPAFATGNVGGPAYAGGLSGAIAAIDREIMAWKALLSMTTADLLGSAGGGGGGGSGNTLKAHIEDLVEWYNLTRQIADIEQKINNIIAKRANITDGRAYLKSLREQQHLLEGQALVQKTLLGYQQKQLELQAEQINTHDIWKQFFHVGSDGLLQYNMGNEVNGGKGTLTLLQQLNQMSGAEQLSYIKNLGYSYVTNDGEQLDGEDLISKFFEEAQAQIDKYDELRDTVESTDEALSKLESSINEIEQEIRDNQKELEEIIYNTLVETWEKQISQLQEQTDMLREANEAYVNGLNDALNKERNQYSQNKSISDRQQLQRQLSLLRRSGGSASQIASLEEQLNSALKEEYFSHQQETIDSIKEANDKQLDALNKQITLQQETLDFQKENGVLWTKVYEVLSQSDGKIMEFLIQNSSEFIQASALAQADMLNEEWAKRIGIYKANSEEGFEPYVQKANQMFATEAWNSAEGPQKQSMFNALDVASQKALQDYFASAFANEMLRNGGDEAAAYEVARQDMYQKLYQAYNQMKNIQNTTLDAIRNISQPSVAPKDNTAGTGGGGSNTGSGSKDNSGSSQKQWLRITYKGLVTTGNSKGKSNGGSPSGPSSLEVGKSGSISWNCYPGFVQGGFKVSDTSKCSVSGSSITALASGSVTVTLNYWDRTPTPAGTSKATTTVKSSTNSSSSAAKTGGGSSGNSLLKKNLFANSLYAASGAFIESDDTPAILHKGEGVFTAGETSALRNMVKNYQTLAANLTGNSLLSAIGGIGSYSFSNTRNAGSELNINPGAVVIHVDKLDDKYDVDELATDVFNKLSTIASKATNRGVNRR